MTTSSLEVVTNLRKRAEGDEGTEGAEGAEGAEGDEGEEVAVISEYLFFTEIGIEIDWQSQLL